MTKFQKAIADFKASPEYKLLVTPADEKSGQTPSAELELRVRRAFTAGWIGDRVNLSTLLDEMAGSQPSPPVKK